MKIGARLQDVPIKQAKDWYTVGESLGKFKRVIVVWQGILV